MKRTFSFLYSLLLLVLFSCNVDNGGLPDEGEPLGKKKAVVQIKFDLKESTNDAKALVGSVSKSSSEVNSIRFRVMYELKGVDTVIVGQQLFDISSSVVELSDTLNYGIYKLTVFGNYVITDGQEKILDQQYQQDEKLGLSKITILNPDKEKQWAFAYSGSADFSVNAKTKSVGVKIERQVLQLQFALSWVYGAVDYVSSDIVVTDFSNCFDATTGKAFVDRSKIELKNIPHTETAYYRLTFFESLQDCSIELTYKNQDGTAKAFKQLLNNEIDPLTNNPLQWYSFDRGYRYSVGEYPTHPNAVRIQSRSTLLGDTEIFSPVERSSVLPSDSLALVDFFNALGGPKWNQPWNLLLPVSTWAGISISAKSGGDPQRVVGINISEQYGSWNNLNNLLGSIPGSVGQLDQLEVLNVSGNITSIDAHVLDNLTKLRELKISKNEFDGTGSFATANSPTLVLTAAVTKLVFFDVKSINIIGFNQLCKNERLERISADLCSVLPGPTETSVVLFENYLQFPALKSLNLRLGVGDFTFSDNLYKIGLLETLSLEGSSVNYEKVCSSFPNLISLSISSSMAGQMFSGSIAKLTCLLSVGFLGTQIQGDLPVELFALKLSNLSLQNEPNITGTLPAQMSGDLQYLRITGTKMSGKLPLFSSNIVSVAFVDNNFEGEVPTQYATYALSFNYGLELKGNRLSGAIPEALKKHPRWKSWEPSKNIYPQQVGYGFTNAD